MVGLFCAFISDLCTGYEDELCYFVLGFDVAENV